MRVVCAAAVARTLSACLRERARVGEREWGGGSGDGETRPRRSETHGMVMVGECCHAKTIVNASPFERVFVRVLPPHRRSI